MNPVAAVASDSHHNTAKSTTNPCVSTQAGIFTRMRLARLISFEFGSRACVIPQQPVVSRLYARFAAGQSSVT